MIEEGCDVGTIVGKITDESVVARLAGKMPHYLVASPALIQSRPAVRKVTDLQSWPWLTISRAQFFGDPKKIVLHGPKQIGQTLQFEPVFRSEGVTSLREAARAGLGAAALPGWLIREDLLAGRLALVLPKWKAPALPVHVVYSSQRLLPLRVRAFIDFALSSLPNHLRARLKRLRSCVSRALSEITAQQATEREVFVEVGPVEPEWRNLDVVQLRFVSTRETRILCDWKPELGPTFHRNHDMTVAKSGRSSDIRQGVHATSEG